MALMGRETCATEGHGEQQPGSHHSEDEAEYTPATASRTLSVRACVMTWRRVAPIAMRSAVCPRRATARASSKFATLAHATSRTKQQTVSKICRLRPYSSFISATPAPAGTTFNTCLGRSWIISGIQLAGYPESFCIHSRRNTVKAWRHLVHRKRRDVTGRSYAATPKLVDGAAISRR